MSPDDRVVISVNKLTVEAGPIRLFENLSFDLEQGQVLILHGSNGVGKTSLLKVLAGFNSPEHGKIKFGTRAELSAYNIHENCHYLGHKNGLKAKHTVFENLDFFQTFDRIPKFSIQDAADLLHFNSLLTLPVSVLSAGQARRVAFARLLVSDRPIWLLDEPTAALDASTSRQFEYLALQHMKQGGMIIAATHLPFLSDHSDCQTLNLDAYQTNCFTSATTADSTL
ncbi:MAG: heme ABC exporter ATP-binding protein CcmA [Maricaulaceae bacterium]